MSSRFYHTLKISGHGKVLLSGPKTLICYQGIRSIREQSGVLTMLVGQEPGPIQVIVQGNRVEIQGSPESLILNGMDLTPRNNNVSHVLDLPLILSQVVLEGGVFFDVSEDIMDSNRLSLLLYNSSFQGEVFTESISVLLEGLSRADFCKSHFRSGRFEVGKGPGLISGFHCSSGLYAIAHGPGQIIGTRTKDCVCTESSFSQGLVLLSVTDNPKQ